VKEETEEKRKRRTKEVGESSMSHRRRRTKESIKKKGTERKRKVETEKGSYVLNAT